MCRDWFQGKRVCWWYAQAWTTTYCKDGWKHNCCLWKCLKQSVTLNTYLSVHLDRKLTWPRHIEAKHFLVKIKVSNLHWLINLKSGLSLNFKVLLYKAFFNPIWTYGIQLCLMKSGSTMEIQRAQLNLIVTEALWYIKKKNFHRSLDIPMVKNEFKNIFEKYRLKL